MDYLIYNILFSSATPGLAQRVHRGRHGDYTGLKSMDGFPPTVTW